MKYQHLLFSRSINRDYRWMITPEYLSSSDLDSIVEYFWLDEIRYILPIHPSTIYLFNLKNCSVLIRLCATKKTDKFGRRIDALQGICVPNYFGWYMRFVLPWILINVEKYLNPINAVNFQNADTLAHTPSESYSFDMSQLNQLPLGITDLISLFKFNLGEQKIQKTLEFSEAGFKQLVELCMPVGRSPLKLLQIAFGIPPEKVNIFASFDIISLLK